MNLWCSLFILSINLAAYDAWLNPSANSGKARTGTAMQASSMSTSDPLLLRAARGEKVERVPVWMMRQAGRHMHDYRELVKKYPTFRERSEIPDVATEISLQPWRRYKTDGCILFSDILTPLPGMGFDFDILEKSGPKMKPIRTMADVDKIHLINPATATPFVAETLKNLRSEVGNATTVLGFVGLPFTLASYMIEGGSSEDYREIKTMAYEQPQMLKTLLTKLADNIAHYANFQIECGAQVIQLFDSWAGHLSPEDYDAFAAPYQRRVVERIKAVHPETPLIMYIKQSGVLLEKMAAVGVDIISLDWTVTIAEARKRLGPSIGLQGNLDPMTLFAPDDVIRKRVEQILKEGGGRRHVMNLGHGIDAGTSEEKAQLFVDLVKGFEIPEVTV